VTPNLDPQRSRPQPVRHDGPCGERLPCPKHGLAFGSNYRPAERLANGWIVAHDCGTTYRTGVPVRLA
jgi:hypothetical protein